MAEPDSVESREENNSEEETVTREESQEELDRRAELDALFSNWEDSESTDTPAYEISLEGLYSHLEQEGLLRLPVMLEELIPSCAEGSTLNPSFWGDWRTKKVRLVRDTSCTDRIKYNTDILELRDISGHPEAWISRVWDGHSVDPLAVMIVLDGKLATYAETVKTNQLTVLQEHEVTRQRELDSRLKSFAEVTRESQSTIALEHEREQAARRARSLTLRIIGLAEEPDEDVCTRVTTIFRDTLRVSAPDVLHATRIGRQETRSRTLLVKFGSVEGRNIVLGNRSMLKGQRLWLDPDLTPIQAEHKRKELQKVKEAQAEGWIAYLREGQAVITFRRREDQ
ncbi:hypothetical protein R1sor_010648 [Riccia sorocarpa]|uniref:Uncharacterized protein n=1 Tax=Riccia sorocarpa TaxID=122646 RepID=A0ABD3HYN1_9MARC